MRRIYFAAAILMVVVASQASAQNVSCSSYLWDICFDVGAGDRVTSTFPADFAINEIELASGAHVTTYEGSGLADPDEAGRPVELRTYNYRGVLVRVYAGTQNTPQGRYFSLRYGPRGNQVFGWFRTVQQQKAIAQFLNKFHGCQRGQPNFATVACSAEPIFKEASEVISTLQTGAN